VASLNGGEFCHSMLRLGLVGFSLVRVKVRVRVGICLAEPTGKCIWVLGMYRISGSCWLDIWPSIFENLVPHQDLAKAVNCRTSKLDILLIYY